MKIGVLLHKPFLSELFAEEDVQRLSSLGEVKWVQGEEKITSEDAIQMLRDCEVGIGSWGTPNPATEGLLQGCPFLRLWIHAAGTVKSMFGAHLEGRDIHIVSCKRAIAVNVAEFAVAEIVLGLRRVLENASDNRKGRCKGRSNRRCLCDSTVGILGASDVGREAIRILSSMSTRRILVYDPFLSEEDAERMGALKVETVHDLAKESHALSVHAPALPSTEKMLGQEHFALLADDAVLVNTSRGMCVDEMALIAELEKGRFFVFLDVSDPEPAAEESPLRSLPNVVYTSHIAGGPARNIGSQAVEAVRSYMRGETPLGTVEKHMLDRLA